jgi:hypothetical protein
MRWYTWSTSSTAWCTVVQNALHMKLLAGSNPTSLTYKCLGPECVSDAQGHDVQNWTGMTSLAFSWDTQQLTKMIFRGCLNALRMN